MSIVTAFVLVAFVAGMILKNKVMNEINEFINGFKADATRMVDFLKGNFMWFVPLLYVALLVSAILTQDDLLQPKQFTIIEVVNDSTALAEDTEGNQVTVQFDDRSVFDNEHKWEGFYVEVTEGEWLNDERTKLVSTFDIWG